MGYWNTSKDGVSLYRKPTGMIWGDEPADAVDKALADIVGVFLRDVGRPPTLDEIKAGFAFSLRAFDPDEYRVNITDKGREALR